jgi:PTS system nitrogen regulatory IIA component
MKLHALLTEDTILDRLDARSRDDVLREMVEHLAPRAAVEPAEDVLAKLLEREKLGTTAIGGGVAIPHCKVSGLKAPLVALGVSRAGVPFDAADGKPVHLIFLVVSPLENPDVNLGLLASIAKLVRHSGSLASKLVKGRTAKKRLEILRRAEEKADD